MKLYIVPGTCSLAPHIVAREGGIPVEIDKIDRTTKLTAEGADYNAINTKTSVPALMLDDGEILTEAAVIMQYLADRKPESGLVPAAGTMERYRVQEWLNFIAGDIHKSFPALFSATPSVEWKDVMTKKLARHFDWIVKQIHGRPYLMGEQFTIADAYLFTVVRWTTRVKLDLAPWPALQQYMARVAERPGVHAAMLAEGLVS